MRLSELSNSLTFVVSIPKGAIMRHCFQYLFANFIWVSIPKGAIMSVNTFVITLCRSEVSIPKGAIMSLRFQKATTTTS